MNRKIPAPMPVRGKSTAALAEGKQPVCIVKLGLNRLYVEGVAPIVMTCKRKTAHLHSKI